jgi:glycosyltransferase involved in cell wall biosynthesis
MGLNMKVHINTQVKNEELLLEKVLPFWQEYPIDEFVFLDDNSTDNTSEVIGDFLGEEATILSPVTDTFHEAKNRSTMLEYSRSKDADIVISIDADELLSQSFLMNFDWLVEQALDIHVFLYQYNVVGSLNKIRQDPEYEHNYRDFIFPMKHTGKFDESQNRYHTPRTPPINLPDSPIKECGFIHLQALNVKFYALKQLWYKVYEYKEYGKSVEEINATYDKVVNGLDFCEIDTPKNIIGDDWKFDASVFDKILEERKYVDYIKEHGHEDLITFGDEYL